jgi:hypothetical protein
MCLLRCVTAWCYGPTFTGRRRNRFPVIRAHLMTKDYGRFCFGTLHRVRVHHPDCCGCHNSDGDWEPFKYESNDGRHRGMGGVATYSVAGCDVRRFLRGVTQMLVAIASLPHLKGSPCLRLNYHDNWSIRVAL